MRRLVMAGVAVVTFSMIAATPALAHGDQRLVTGEVALDVGETVAFPGELHYHRLVGRFAATGPISVRLVDETTGAAVIDSKPGSDIALNELIRCCEGMGWAPHRLEIENRADRPVVVDAGVTLVHDDLAVSVFRAEAGVVEGMLALAGIWVYGLVRTRRRAACTPRAALATLIVVSASVVVIATIGNARYGTGSVPGLLAGAVDIPLFPVNPIASRASVIAFMAMAGWAVAGSRWIAARDRMNRVAWSALGLAVVGAAIVAAALVMIEYRTLGMPAFFAALAVLPICVALIVERRQPVATTTPTSPIAVEPV